MKQLKKSDSGSSANQSAATGESDLSGPLQIESVNHTTRKPSSVLPASPMNVRMRRLRKAGKLNGRNPRIAPQAIAATANAGALSPDASAPAARAISAIEAARPSIPSTQLKALITVSVITTDIGMARGPSPKIPDP